MRNETIQDILSLVEQPSRYLGSEVNSIKKDPSRIKLSVALAFPEVYELATSHFGLQILYHILNSQEEIMAERVYAPAADMESRLRHSRIPLSSLESGKPMGSFDIVGFSLLYELNYTNVLNMLNLAGIPIYASQRDLSSPMVIAGGPCTCNPEPVAAFFDAILVGDGEEAILEMAEAWLRWKMEPKPDKDALLKTWSRIRGVYISSFFETKTGTTGMQTVVPLAPAYKSVTRAIVADLDGAPFPEAPIVPFGRPVHDRLRLEIARGCSRGCRFCQAGMIYRPVRERSVDTLLDQVRKALRSTGYEDLSLLSLSTGDYQCIVSLMERLMAECQSDRIAVSLPSIRAGTLTAEMMGLIRRVRKTGFTIAPEAGSQRLRSMVNKQISQDEVAATVEDAFRLGWQVIKLYFMVGFPTETQADLSAIVDLVMDLRKIRGPGGKRGRFNVSVATFIPKPHTPFQWAPQIDLAAAKERLGWLRARLNLPGFHFKWQNPETSMLEGLWSRGDRRLSRLLVAATERGCKFDGWSDSFNYRSWSEALSDTGIDIDAYTTRERDCSEPLPWDHIDTGVTKAFLKREWDRALSGQHTPDCRRGDCQSCGVCDFERIEPKLFGQRDKTAVKGSLAMTSKEKNYKLVKVVYSKVDQGRFFGHLETAKLFSRAIRRAGIPVKYSEGFHPKQKISFDDPLPLGIESRSEILYVEIPERVPTESVIEGINENLPPGLIVNGCERILKRPPGKASRTTEYSVLIEDDAHTFDEALLERFLNGPGPVLITRKRKKGEQRLDLKCMIEELALLDASRLRVKLRSESGRTVRPREVLGHVFGLPPDAVRQARIIKLA